MPNTSERPNNTIEPTRPAIRAALAAFDDLERRLMSLHAPAFAGVDLTMSQAKLLYVVTATGELSISEVSRRLGVTVSTASGAVDRLVELGFVTRSEDPSNRRQMRVNATAQGIETLEELRELSTRQLRALFEVLRDDQLAIVEEALRHLGSAVELVAADADARAGTPTDQPDPRPRSQS